MGAGGAAGMQAAGGIVSAYGAYTQGLAQSNYYKYLAANSRTQEGLVENEARQQTTFAQDQGAYQTKMLGRKTAEMEGAQRSAAGSNVGGGSVTTEDIARDTFEKSHLDEMAIKYNADLKSWQAQNAANLKKYALENEARGYDFSAKESKRAGKINAISSLLGSSGQVANTWMSRKELAPA